MVEGTDIARVHQLVGRLNQMNVVQVGYGLSRGTARGQRVGFDHAAIIAFPCEAQSMAKDFGCHPG